MNKFTGLFLALCMGIVMPNFAQKKNHQTVAHTYTQLPLTPLPSEVKTYQTITKTDGGDPYKAWYTVEVGVIKLSGKEHMQIPEGNWIDKEKEWEKQYLALAGYAPSRIPDVEVELHFGILKVKEGKQDRSRPCGTAKNGRKLYTTSYVYSCPVELTVRLAESKKVILQQVIFDDSERRKKINGRDLSLLTRDQELYDLMTDITKKAYTQAGQIIRSQISKEKVTAKLTIFSYASKKHDYSDLDKAQQIIMDGFASQNYESMASAVLIYNKALASASEDKKARINPKVTEGIKFNKALVYFLVEDFENAKATLSHIKVKGTNSSTKEKSKVGNFLNKHVQVSFNGQSAGSAFRGNGSTNLTKKINSGKDLLQLILDTERRFKANGKL